MFDITKLMNTTKDTIFGAFNAITGYFQNVHTYKDDKAKVSSLLMRVTGQLWAQSAFNLCTDFAAKGADALLLN